MMNAIRDIDKKWRSRHRLILDLWLDFCSFDRQGSVQSSEIRLDFYLVLLRCCRESCGGFDCLSGFLHLDVSLRFLLVLSDFLIDLEFLRWLLSRRIWFFTFRFRSRFSFRFNLRSR